MKHTYLFQEAIWQSTGLYINENGGVVKVEGKSVVTHGLGVWRIESLMRLIDKKSNEYSTVEYKNSYEIDPFQDGKDYTTWISSNTAIGKLEGQFVVVEDTLLSLFQTRTGSLRGMEYMRMINEDQYRNKGTLFDGRKKVSSWSIDLRRQVTAL